MSIFQVEKTYKQSEVESVLKQWYKLNVDNNKLLPEKHSAWEPILQKLTKIQYQVLRMLFKIDDIKDIDV